MSDENSGSSSPTKNWVQFEEEDKKGSSPSSSSGVSSARGSVKSVSEQNHKDSEGASFDVSEVQHVNEETLRKKNSVALKERQRKMSLDNVSLEEEQTVQQQQPNSERHGRGRQFENGDAIVTLLPVNERFPWFTPAKFRPELVPEELMAPVLTLTVEEYVQSMEKLTTDMRFTLYNICYKRILVMWIALAFTILLALLFSGFKGIYLFGCGVAWLVMNAGAIFFCMWIKLKLNKQLERCMASINANLLKHNILLGLDDRGKLSCHKVHLCFMYFEAKDCITKLESILAEKPEEPAAQNGGVFDRDSYLRHVEQFDDVEVVVSGRNAVRIDRKQERAEKLFLHYIQRWSKDYLRRRLDWMVDDLYGRTEYAANTNPRHLKSALCPCQYIEEHLRNKRHRESLNPCQWGSNPCHWCD